MSICKDVMEFHKLLNHSMDLLEMYLSTRLAEYRKHEEEMDQRNKSIVFHENIAFLETELDHIDKTIKFIKDMEMSGYSTVDGFRDDLLKKISEYYHKNGIPNACTVIMTEKINKSYDFYKQISSD